MRTTKPSPPVTTNQSLFVEPFGDLRARRSAERAVVLRAAVDVVDRRRVVDFDVVELRHRQVGEVLPQPAAVPGLVEPAVAAFEQVARCCRDRSRSRGCRRACCARRAARNVAPAVVGDLRLHATARRCDRGPSDRDGCSRNTSAAPARWRAVPRFRRCRARRTVPPGCRRIRPWRRPGLCARVKRPARCGRHRRPAGRCGCAATSRRRRWTCAGRSPDRRGSASRCGAGADAPTASSTSGFDGSMITSLMPVCSLMLRILFQVAPPSVVL